MKNEIEATVSAAKKIKKKSLRKKSEDKDKKGIHAATYRSFLRGLISTPLYSIVLFSSSSGKVNAPLAETIILITKKKSKKSIINGHTSSIMMGNEKRLDITMQMTARITSIVKYIPHMEKDAYLKAR